MSELLTAAAAALGLPESLVQRSAEARAADIGASVDDVLTEWSGGEAAPVTAPSAGEEGDGVSDETPAPEATPAPASEPEPTIAVPSQPPPTPEPVAAGPYVPPVLVGTEDRPGVVLAAILGLFAVVLLVGLVGPSIPIEEPGARTSEISYSSAAEEGQHLFVNLGCAACHTQMVRPVVADVGIGPVTLNDTNQVLGTRRFGPDLADIGTRMDQAQMEDIVGGGGEHPGQSLSEEDLGYLVAYLSESSYGEGS